MIVETIPSALAGERLDRIVALMAECSRSEAVGLIDDGAVLLDGEVATVGKVRLVEGQVVSVDPTLLPAIDTTARAPRSRSHCRFFSASSGGSSRRRICSAWGRVHSVCSHC